MKTKAILFLSAVALFFSLIPSLTNAQFKKGDMLVEGDLGNIIVGKTKTQSEQNGIVGAKQETNPFSIGISPRVGFFISKNFVVGTTLGLTYSSTKNKYTDPVTGIKSGDSKSSAFVLDFLPFVRYYFPGKSATTRFYGQIDGGIDLYLSQKNDSKDYDNAGVVTSTYKTNYPKKFNTISVEALLGVNHFVSQNVAINAALGYSYAKGTETTTTTYTQGNFTSTSTPQKYTSKGGAFVWNVGFTMLIPCKKKK